MFIRTPMQTGYGSIIHCWVSLPRVPGLVDNVKYWEPGVKPQEDDTELRRHRSRGPTLRSLVKLAIACETAEEMGQKLKRRFDRSLRRKGVRPADAGAEGELEHIIGK